MVSAFISFDVTSRIRKHKGNKRRMYVYQTDCNDNLKLETIVH